MVDSVGPSTSNYWRQECTSITYSLSVHIITYYSITVYNKYISYQRKKNFCFINQLNTLLKPYSEKCENSVTRRNYLTKGYLTYTFSSPENSKSISDCDSVLTLVCYCVPCVMMSITPRVPCVMTSVTPRVS